MKGCLRAAFFDEYLEHWLTAPFSTRSDQFGQVSAPFHPLTAHFIQLTAPF